MKKKWATITATKFFDRQKQKDWRRNRVIHAFTAKGDWLTMTFLWSTLFLRQYSSGRKKYFMKETGCQNYVIATVIWRQYTENVTPNEVACF